MDRLNGGSDDFYAFTHAMIFVSDFNMRPWRLDGDGKSAHWRTEMESVTDRERDSLAGLLFAMGLRRHAAARNFAGLRELLEFGSTEGLVDTPVASQAAELLARVAHLGIVSPGLPVYP